MNYRIACEHYSRNHGRNVLMCPYCEQYFLLSNLLTKHVLAQHPEDEIQSKSVSTFYKGENQFIQNNCRKPSKVAAIIYFFEMVSPGVFFIVKKQTKFNNNVNLKLDQKYELFSRQK